jgi:hypothetical protein
MTYRAAVPPCARSPDTGRSGRSRAGEQAHRVAVAADLQPVAVVLDLVHPVGALVSPVGMQGGMYPSEQGGIGQI